MVKPKVASDTALHALVRHAFVLDEGPSSPLLDRQSRPTTILSPALALRRARGREPVFGGAFGREISIIRRLLFELCLDLWIVLVSGHALKGKRVLYILGN